jgi:hypothetical protein
LPEVAPAAYTAAAWVRRALRCRPVEHQFVISPDLFGLHERVSLLYPASGLVQYQFVFPHDARVAVIGNLAADHHIRRIAGEQRANLGQSSAYCRPPPVLQMSLRKRMASRMFDLPDALGPTMNTLGCRGISTERKFRQFLRINRDR